MTSSLRGRLVPAGLIALSAVPILAGAFRLSQLAGSAPVTPENARFEASPVPVVVHIVGATVFCLLGALQFAPGWRRTHRRWHRVAGRIVLPAGLAAALSGMWMALFYPRPPADDVLLTPIRLVFGSLMAVSLVLGYRAVRRRDFAAHRAWMARGYAVGIAAGTQVFTHLPLLLLTGTPGGYPRVVAMTAGWVINLAVVEWALRRRPAARRTVRPAEPATV